VQCKQCNNNINNNNNNLTSKTVDFDTIIAGSFFQGFKFKFKCAFGRAGLSA